MMRISLVDLIHQNEVCFLKKSNKEAALTELIDCLREKLDDGTIKDIKEAIFHRENLMSTGIGLGIGIPHCRLKNIKELLVVVGVAKEGIPNYETIDAEAVKIIFLIVGGVDQQQHYIQLLSQIVKSLKESENRKLILETNDEASLYQVIIETVKEA